MIVISEILICLIGESGSGKSSVAKKLIENYPEYHFKELKSYTTRQPRFNGEDTHTFISLDEFKNIKNKVAYLNYKGAEYCASQKQVDENDIYVVDPEGYKMLRKKYCGDKVLLPIYIKTNIFIRFYRMCKRGDNINNIFIRIINDRKVFKDAASSASFIVSNYDLNKTVEKIMKRYVVLDNCIINQKSHNK